MLRLSNLLTIPAVLVVCLVASTSKGVEWTGADGPFDDASNWDGGAVPDFEEALINNGGTATLSGNAELESLRIGLDGGSGSFVQTGGELSAAGAFIGDNSMGSAVISSGEFLIGDTSIHVGWRPGGVGSMTINGADAIVSSADDFQLGREGTGTLDFIDGQLTAGFTVIGKFGTGVWNQSGGFFDQAFGDIEIGDGGRDDQADIDGPRTGTMNVSDGIIQGSGHLAIGNRRGGGDVNISGGIVAMTGDDDGNIYVGRGADSSPESGQGTTLRIIGNAATVVANGSLLMNVDEVSTSSTLVAQLTGSEHTPILLGGGADVSNGTLKIALDNYSPTASDSWLLVQAGMELDDVLDGIDMAVDAAGYEPLEHQFPLEAGDIIGPFANVDTSEAILPPGLSWDVQYSGDSIILAVMGEGGGLLGDFDGDGTLGAGDIDALSAEVRAGGANLAFDLNGDGAVDNTDRQVWVESTRQTYFGDSNLDGEFSSGDLVAVFTVGEYEDGVAGNSGWSEGDWNGDGEFDTTDFVAAFSAGGYELGPRAASMAAVPEPSSALLLLVGCLVWGRIHRV